MVNKYVASSGHALKVRGAHGYIDEVDEARRVVNEVDKILKTEYNGDGYVYHDNTSTSQSQNLRTITNFHNSKERHLDLSVHFNASASASATGVEVLHFGGHTRIAAKLSKGISVALGLADRGQKVRKDLYVLKNTNRPALLLEVCFVSSKKDADAYKRNFDKLCHAIAEFVADYLNYDIKKPSTTEAVATANTETFFKKGAALGLYRVTKACATYNGVDFTQSDKLQTLKVGTAFTVTDIVKFGNKYRFKTKMGEYVSAKRSHLQKV